MALTAPIDVVAAERQPAEPAAPTPGTVPARRRLGLTLLFGTTAFVSAALLFAVEPMVARMLLPVLGGSPAVWNTAMVFFQAALLGGYAWAHLTTTRLRPGRHIRLHVLLMAAPIVVLPVGLAAGWTLPARVDPVRWTLIVLVVLVGAPFAALATAGPAVVLVDRPPQRP